MDDQRLLTAKLALKRASLTACFLLVAALLYPWLCALLLPTGDAGGWPYLVWSVSLAACFPIVTVAERKLGPLRARHQALLLVAGSAFALLWAAQLSHLTGVAQGKTQVQLLGAAFQTLQGIVSGPRSFLHSLAWLASLALPLLLLAHARRARVHFLIQFFGPAALAILIEVGARALSMWSLGINHEFNAWSLIYALPKAAGCAGYVLAAAWTDRSSRYQQKT